MATAAPIQFHPSMALMTNTSAAVSGTPVFTSGAGPAGQEAHQQGLLYMARSAAAVRTQQGQQQQQGIPHQQHIGAVNQVTGGSLAVSLCV